MLFRSVAIGNPMKVVNFYCDMLAKTAENGNYAVADIDGSDWLYGCLLDAEHVEIMRKKMMNVVQKCSNEFIVRRLDAGIEAIENNTVRKYGFESKITILVFTLTEKIRKATGNLDTTF